MSWRGVFLLLLAAGPALAQEGSDLAPDSAITPETRPDAPGDATPDLEEDAAEAPSGDGASPGSAAEEEPVLSEDEEPAEAAEAPEAGAAPGPGERPALIPPEEVASQAEASEAGGGPAAAPVVAESPEELAACLSELDALGVVYEPAEPVTEADNPACGIPNPVLVTEIAPGVLLEPASPMRCATALAAGRWAREVLVPLGLKLEGRGGVTAIDQGAPYVCRPRADGAPSEHGTGSALDVMGFRFASGDPIPVEPRAGEGTMEEAFQRAVRAGACLDFPTVLGPGSDEDHADHLHLDVKARDGGFRICE